MAIKLVSRPNQQFECRDCPARCCSLPWSIRFSAEERRRYLAEGWVRDRAGADGIAVLERGVLPMREKDRCLQCVFLDDDLLCGMQKKFGHSFIPRSCQVFPFGFTKDERDVVLAQLSGLCPSIRDDYGAPVGKKVLEAKLDQKGGPGRMTKAMATRDGVIVSQPEYLRAVSYWDEQLAQGGSPAATLARLHDWMTVFEEALPKGAERATSATAATAIERAAEVEPYPLVPRRTDSFHARLLFAFLLGFLCYPSRLRIPNRVGGGPALVALRAFGNKLAFILGRGTVDMLFVARPVKLQRVRTVARFLAEPEGELVRDHLRLVLQRRHVLAAPRHLLAVVLDLGSRPWSSRASPAAALWRRVGPPSRPTTCAKASAWRSSCSSATPPSASGAG